MYQPGIVGRTREERLDIFKAWNRPDKAFFAAGACHILGHLFSWMHRDEGFKLVYIKPNEGFPGSHMYASDGTWAFDFNGWTLEKELLETHTAAYKTHFPDWNCTKIVLENGLLDNVEGHLPPQFFPYPPWERAYKYIQQFPSQSPKDPVKKSWKWKVAATQLQDIQGDIPAALQVIEAYMAYADVQRVDVLCFPECFLQGYTLDKSLTKNRAISLTSDEFQAVLKKLKRYKTAAIIGLIEEEDGGYFNTAVVIHKGKLLGKYRKVHIFEENFTPGEQCPIFTINNVTFGINICYDARFPEGALALAAQGAQVIFYPLNNRLATEKAVKYRNKHLPNLIDRATESKCYIVSSDVIHQDSDTLAYGCSAIVGPRGDLLERVPESYSWITSYEGG
ncbi:MAG: Nitrilase/cyanide hydratase and apolipoprotein N-acyltransferase [Patescibacteria group bacterium]|nr:Nitrilase/cyanide hydratase and apolipoprotein N-acyltransferase [Patescibacteria group bacterium]